MELQNSKLGGGKSILNNLRDFSLIELIISLLSIIALITVPNEILMVKYQSVKYV